MTNNELNELKELDSFYENVLLMGGTNFIYGDFLISKTRNGLWKVDGLANDSCLCLNFELPYFIKVIGTNAFFGTYFGVPSDFPSITIPKGVEIIEPMAFKHCIKLAGVNFPSTLKEIGDEAFSNCHIISLYIPDNVKKIDRGAFANNRYLKTLSLPNGIHLGDYAFKGCGRLVNKKEFSLKIRKAYEDDIKPRINKDAFKGFKFEWETLME